MSEAPSTDEEEIMLLRQHIKNVKEAKRLLQLVTVGDFEKGIARIVQAIQHKKP